MTAGTDQLDVTPWRPANEPELIMYHALLRADQPRFFQTVLAAPLYLAGTSAGQRSLVSWEREGRTHLLVFTSPEGLAAVLGATADTIIQVSYPQLVRDWPNPGWWLALNPNLPIDAVLQVNDIAAAAKGELEIPMPRPQASDAPVEPGMNELELGLAEALAQNNLPILLDFLVFANVLLPTLRPVTGGFDLDDPYFPWRALQIADELSIAVFTSPERLAEAGVDGPTVTVPFLSMVLAWPGADYTLQVNPGSRLRARLPPDQLLGLPEWARISARYHGIPLG